MPMKFTVTSGFITNSSSVVHGFDRRLLEDPDVKAFIDAYDMADGWVENVWYRSNSSFAVSESQIEQIESSLADSEYCAINMTLDKDAVWLVYGDEYESLVSQLNDLLQEAEERMDVKGFGGDYFN